MRQLIFFLFGNKTIKFVFAIELFVVNDQQKCIYDVERHAHDAQIVQNEVENVGEVDVAEIRHDAEVEL